MPFQAPHNHVRDHPGLLHFRKSRIGQDLVDNLLLASCLLLMLKHAGTIPLPNVKRSSIRVAKSVNISSSLLIGIQRRCNTRNLLSCHCNRLSPPASYSWTGGCNQCRSSARFRAAGPTVQTTPRKRRKQYTPTSVRLSTPYRLELTHFSILTPSTYNPSSRFSSIAILENRNSGKRSPRIRTVISPIVPPQDAFPLHYRDFT